MWYKQNAFFSCCCSVLVMRERDGHSQIEQRTCVRISTALQRLDTRILFFRIILYVRMCAQCELCEAACDCMCKHLLITICFYLLHFYFLFLCSIVWNWNVCVRMRLQWHAYTCITHGRMNARIRTKDRQCRLDTFWGKETQCK